MFKEYLDGINQRGVILASASLGRKRLLTSMGVNFEVEVSGFPEDRDWREFPSAESYALFNAREKLKAINSPSVIIAADTVVFAENQVFEKPADREDLKRMMRAYSGKTHEIMTAIIVKGTITQEIVDKTLVSVDELTEEDIECIANSPEEWEGRAGGYSINGKLGCTLFRGINGSFHTVIGLPTFQLAKMLVKEHKAYLQSLGNS